MADSTERNERHKRAMQRKKEHIDGRIAEATIDKGLLVILTGNGKGKSSSAFGMLARSVGPHRVMMSLISSLPPAEIKGWSQT